MEVSISTDADGYLSQECPSCEQRFKVVFGEGGGEPISFCPYCGYSGQDCWYTKEQVNHMQAVAANVVMAPELRRFRQKIQGMSSGLLSFDVTYDLSEPSALPVEDDSPFDALHFPCCNETIKVEMQQRHFCLICGTEVDMEVSEAQKIFLSHKTSDKTLVLDFKKTLDLLGYETWLDDEAMPAGDEPERAMLQGMRESCAVVFFITPSFKDEGYLRNEINLAVREKRNKGDKFAIITLLLRSDGGETAPIPGLLETYVWKKPETKLEALREIIRALPVSPGDVEWRDGIAGVASRREMPSRTAELSAEAQAILREAACARSDGMVMNEPSMNDHHVYAGHKQMIPDQEPRTVALWKGGLEDLQRRRYIKDIGHEGKVFEVTREGYDAADEISEN